MLDAEVVALVEINPISALEVLRQGLEEKGVVYKTTVLPQKGNLHIGVLFKKGITAQNSRMIPESDLGDPKKRQAFVVDVTIGKFDFILIAVHFKSGRGAAEQRIRDEQAKVVARYISETLEEGREDIVLLGDFNMIPGQDVSNFHYLGGNGAHLRFCAVHAASS